MYADYNLIFYKELCMFALELDYVMSVRAEIDALEKVIKSLKEIRDNLELEDDDWLEFRISRLELKLSHAKDITAGALGKLSDIEV
jgi:hypothetical protein